jgi:rhodanese-related sulfurtransferase
MINDAAKKRMEQAAAAVEQIDARNVADDQLGDWLVIDVREDHEYADGHLPGAISWPRSRLEMEAAQADLADRDIDQPALVYCGSGKRSLLAAHTLKELGLERPVSMEGGFKAWRAAGKAETRD